MDIQTREPMERKKLYRISEVAGMFGIKPELDRCLLFPRRCECVCYSRIGRRYYQRSFWDLHVDNSLYEYTVSYAFKDNYY